MSRHLHSWNQKNFNSWKTCRNNRSKPYNGHYKHGSLRCFSLHSSLHLFYVDCIFYQYSDAIYAVKHTNPFFSKIFYFWEHVIINGTRYPVFFFYSVPIPRLTHVPVFYKIFPPKTRWFFFPQGYLRPPSRIFPGFSILSRLFFRQVLDKMFFFPNVSIELPEDFSVKSWFLTKLALIPSTIWKCLSLHHGLKHASKKFRNEFQINFCEANTYSATTNETNSSGLDWTKSRLPKFWYIPASLAETNEIYLSQYPKWSVSRTNSPKSLRTMPKS